MRKLLGITAAAAIAGAALPAMAGMIVSGSLGPPGGGQCITATLKPPSEDPIVIGKRTDDPTALGNVVRKLAFADWLVGEQGKFVTVQLSGQTFVCDGLTTYGVQSWGGAVLPE